MLSELNKHSTLKKYEKFLLTFNRIKQSLQRDLKNTYKLSLVKSLVELQIDCETQIEAEYDDEGFYYKNYNVTFITYKKIGDHFEADQEFSSNHLCEITDNSISNLFLLAAGYQYGFYTWGESQKKEFNFKDHRKKIIQKIKETKLPIFSDGLFSLLDEEEFYFSFGYRSDRGHVNPVTLLQRYETNSIQYPEYFCWV